MKIYKCFKLLPSLPWGVKITREPPSPQNPEVPLMTLRPGPVGSAATESDVIVSTPKVFRNTREQATSDNAGFYRLPGLGL